MLGKTDNADADYYIPRRPIHSNARAGPPTKLCVRVCVCCVGGWLRLYRYVQKRVLGSQLYVCNEYTRARAVALVGN